MVENVMKIEIPNAHPPLQNEMKWDFDHNNFFAVFRLAALG